MGRRSTLAILFYIHRGKFKKGKHPIIMRISINATTAMLYTKRFTASEDWNVKKKRIDPGHADASVINGELERLENLVFHYHKQIISERGFITADMVKKAILDESEQATLLNIFRKHNAEYKKRAGRGCSPQTPDCYEVIYRSIEKFIRMQYNAEDIALKKLNIDFINNCEFYLRATRGLSSRTTWQQIMLLRKIVRIAVSKGLLSRDPFLGYVPERLRLNSDFITEKELHRILALDINDPDLCFARDMFVFSAFTGLSMCDIQSLNQEHICSSSDGELWIVKKRENTEMNSKIFLFDIPRRIIQKYNGRRNGNNVFDMPDRTTISKHMRTISEICGFERRVIFRMARPCFAGLITLKHGIPVETVSRMMGYSTAEAAGKFININRQKVAADMDTLNEKMADLYKLQDSAFSWHKKSKGEDENATEWRTQ